METLKTAVTRSSSEFGRVADRMPSGMPKTAARINDSAANANVGGKACITKFITDVSVTKSTPRSPCAALTMKLPTWA